MISLQQRKILTLLLFLIAVETISPWSTIPVGTTFLWWAINTVTLFALLVAKPKFYESNNNSTNLVIFIYLFWNLSCIVRGAFIAENYWEWKNLVTMSFVLLLPLILYISTHRLLVQALFTQYIKYILPAFLLVMFIISRAAWGIFLIPISILILFLPLLTKKWQITIVCISLFAATASFGARSTVIKFTVPILLTALFYLRPLIGPKLLGLGRLLLLGLPIVLLILGLSGLFNVFKIDQYVKGNVYTNSTSNGEKEDLTADTRTGLYAEVLASAIKNNYLWWGRTPARGNDSLLFGEEIEAQTNTGKYERFSNEVSILNVFTWTGLIGVILYFLIFIRASYLAIHKSKSWYMKLLGLYLCFRWAYAWVEDFSNFDLSYILLWILIGMCFSTSFRSMTDGEFKYWVRGIFDIRYRKATLKKVRLIKINENGL